MKKIVILFIVVFCIQILTAETITLSYNFKIPKLVINDGYTEFNYQDCHNSGKEGYPNLPYFSTNILLQQYQEIDEIKIISSEYYPVQNGITVKPASKQFPISTGKQLDYKVLPDEEIYNSAKTFPRKVVDNIGTNFLSGHSIAAFTICPISYIPLNSQIKFLKSVTIEIRTTTSRSSHTVERLLRNSQQVKDRIQTLVENPEMLDQYTHSMQNRDEEEDLLLITNNTLLPSFNDYIEFKESTGFIVEAVTTEFIYANYIGVDSQEKIRNCIIDHYTNNGISYVILGGDADVDNPSDLIVPHRGMSAVDDDDIPSDMYYAGLDGNWNTDGDGIWGEQNEWDLYAEVSIGRICVDSAAEIANFTHKLEMYQDSPVVGDIEKALMLGEELNNAPQTNGGTYKNQIVTGGIFDGYTTTGISPNISISTLYQMDQSYTMTDIFDHFNTTGLNLMNHLGHSNVTYNMLMNNSDITTTNFTNDGISKGYVVGYSQGCYNGSFDNRNTSAGSYSSDDSFAEKITTLENAEVAAIANSRYGWYSPGGTNSSSQYYDRQFYDAIFGQNITSIGEANRYSKEEDVTQIEGDEYMRWTAYELNLFGDPSMDIWTDAPIAMNVTYPSSVSLGMSSIQFTSDAPYARIGLIQDGELIGRAVADATGDVTVSLFAPIAASSEISVSIIAHNKFRHQGTIVVVSDEAFVIYDSHFINDPTGNDDGFADYGENITLDMILENVGTHDALGVNAVFSSVDSYVAITDNTQSYGSITAGLTSTQIDAYALSIENDVPDQHIIDFDLVVTGTSSRETWNSTFQITVNAPELSLDDLIIDDSAENNNGRLDPGETVDLIIPTNNDGHSNSLSAVGVISCSNTDISFNGSNIHNFGIINAGSSANAVYNVTVDPDTDIGSNVPFEFTVTAGSYNAIEIYNRLIGLIVEDFESGNFVSFPWENAGNANWSVVPESPYEGTYCTKSGTITHSQTSELVLVLDVTADGNISFFRKVSSESGYDYLRFYIDGVEKGLWSGEVAWSEISYPITAGTRTFKWEYMKDGSVDTGSDCAWVDFIIFPAIYLPDPPEITVNQSSFEKTLQPDHSSTAVLTIGNIGEEQLDYSTSISYDLRYLDQKDPGKKSFYDKSRAYCTSVGGGGDEFIANVTIGAINNTTVQSYYGDYTASSTPVNVGESYPITITNGDPNWTTDQCGVWIDWNQNEDFTDDSPIVVTGSPGIGPYTANIIPPVDALSGTARMRIQIIYSATPDPCLATFSYGEVEDYSLEVNSDFVNWLTLTPSAGSVVSGSSSDIDVIFDSAGLDLATYNATIIIEHNDPDEPDIEIPVTLTVSQELDVPENVTITTTPNGTSVDILISWTVVPGATSYTVYRSSDPNATFPGEWTAVTGIIGTTWSYTTDRAKRFYIVTANN